MISRQNWARAVAVGAFVAALGVSACGRKGPLDAPPSAGHSQDVAATPDGVPQSGLANRQPGVGNDGKAVAPPPSGQNRPFILDWLVE